jgi:hypothetical protein
VLIVAEQVGSNAGRVLGFEDRQLGYRDRHELAMHFHLRRPAGRKNQVADAAARIEHGLDDVVGRDVHVTGIILIRAKLATPKRSVANLHRSTPNSDGTRFKVASWQVQCATRDQVRFDPPSSSKPKNGRAPRVLNL